MLKVHWDVECRKYSEFVIKKDYYICFGRAVVCSELGDLQIF